MDGETIFAIVVGIALAAFSLVMVSYSFFRGSSTSSGQAQSSPSPSGDDGVGSDSIYDSIDTLELEYQLGNLPEEQYREQLQRYRLEAAAAIKSQLEQGAAAPELLLEQEVIAARSELRSAEPAEGWQACPQCDAPIPTTLGQSSGACPHCSAQLSDSGLKDSQDAESC